MNLRTLARRSLRHYFRSHLGVLAGVTLAAAVLIGALAVGDSVKGSLVDQALARLGGAHFAVQTGDRFFTRDLDARFREAYNFGLAKNVANWQINTNSAWLWGGIQLRATVSRQDGSARANHVQFLALGDNYFERVLPEGVRRANATGVWVNSALAGQLSLKVGDELVIRVPKPSALSQDAIISPRDDVSLAFRLPVAAITPPGAGELNLDANQQPMPSLFVSRGLVEEKLGLKGRANLMLVGGDRTLTDKHLSKLDDFSNSLHWRADTNAAFRVAANAVSGPMQWIPSKRTFALPYATVEDAFRVALNNAWSVRDAELEVRINEAPVDSSPFAELTTRRIFLEPAVVRAALANESAVRSPQSAIPAATQLLTYLVNGLAHGGKLTPYSMVTAAGAPYTPANLKEDEIVVNQWLADDLGVKPGDSLALTYYRVDAGTQLQEHTNTFRVHSIVPLAGLHADRTLMPEFPGLAKAESTHDWDAGFDLVHPIRDQDEAYWKQHRGTPKALITLAAGQKLWANRFGELTAIRWFAGSPPSKVAGEKPGSGESGNGSLSRPPTFPPAVSLAQLRDDITARIRANLNPADVGLVWRPVRAEALRAAESGTGQEFGGLMIGFSFFLITSALLLTAMLFRFSLQQRTAETGILLALGWPPGRVRGLLFREGLALSVLGTLLGAVLGTYYAKGVLWGLTTIWRDAIAGAGLEFHLTPSTLFTGIALSVSVAAVTLFLALRQQANRSARELLNEGANECFPGLAGKGLRRPRLFALVASVLALGMVGTAWATRETKPEMFFGAGALLLVSGILWVRVWILNLAPGQGGLGQLALRALGRRPSRSLGTIALLASAAFLIVAIAAMRLDASRHADRRESGTGGFALWGESSLPVIKDLNTAKGQEFYGLNPGDMKGVSFVQLRVRDGDDASCLNLNGAQRPRLLGVKPGQLAERGAFTFTKVLMGLDATNGWLALNQPLLGRGSITSPSISDGAIPAIGDAASIQWALKNSVGGTLDFTDERGQPFKVRIAGAVANSILQGNLLIAEADFVRLFPSESGYRGFLVDAPPAARETVSAALSRALLDVGFELTPTTRRLAQFNAVQNTYLNTFQILGGLGLLLGSGGLAVVVLRNVRERRGELGLMLALGFEAAALRRLVLTEHAALLLLGLGVGLVTALVGVLPSLGAPGSEFPWRSLTVTLALVLANGLAWTVWATFRSLRGRLLDSLREL
jgi:ABC-type antimicrobial peptide transport system permease subunit